MTTIQNQDKKNASLGPVSLSFDQETLAQGIRVSPAQFSRMCEVSRQTVSRWIQSGLVQLYPDGLLDPAESVRRVVENTDPARLRARIFKNAGRSLDDWRRKAEACESELKAARERITYLDGFIDELNLIDELFLGDIAALIETLIEDTPEAIRARLNEMYDNACGRAGLQNGTLTSSDLVDEFSNLDAELSALEDGIFHPELP